MDDASAADWATRELQRLVEIRSYSGEEHDVMRYLEARATELGLPVQAQPVSGAGPNLLVSWSPRPRLLLTAHLDTVVPTWEWSGRATVRGTRVYGLGAQDDKGGAVACLLGLVLALENGVDLESRSVGVGFCVDEEVGGRGSRTMARHLEPLYVVALEGTDLSLALAEAGFLDVDIRVSGKAVHGSLREEGDNAVEKAARLIVALGELPFTRRRHSLLGSSISSVEEFHGGSALNAVPESAAFRLSARLLPGVVPDDVVAELQEACKSFDAELTVLGRATPYETSPEAGIVRALAAATEQVLGAAPATTGMPAVTDGHSFVELAGSETVVFGPGHLRDSHRPDEHIDIREVVKCARIFARLIADWDPPASLEPSRERIHSEVLD